MTIQHPSTPVEVFCSYAHEDEHWLHKLETHMIPLKQQGLIALWHDRLITPGTNWAQTIDRHLDTASVILLLVSTDFFASNYCVGIEMKRALERQEGSEALVIPILVEEVNWPAAPLTHLQALPADAKPLALWSDEETALADVAAGIRRAIEALPLLAASAPRAALPTIWNVPYPRNSFFLGRDSELAQIHQNPHEGQAMALSQPQAISGLGGIGKTQIALEYAYRFHQEYQAVLWARAESIDALNSSYLEFATLLRLPERGAQEQEVIVQAVKRWLQTHREWLLILDNAEDLSIIPHFLPSAIAGHLLLTTRASSTGRLAHRLEVDILSSEQGALLLLRRAGLLPSDAPLEQAASHERDLALHLAQELGSLPLALDQAGAYLEETRMAPADYLSLYQQHRAILLNERRGGYVSDHPLPVATTWSLSFQKVEQKDPAAAQLLRLAAFLAPDAIPEEVFTESANVLEPPLAAVRTDPLRFNQALEALHAYSLIRRHSTNHTLSVHRLVQAVLQDSLSEAEQKQWAEYALLAVNAVFPDVEYTMWFYCDRLLAHALAVSHWIDHYYLTREQAAQLLNQTASYLEDRARYAEAEPLFLRTLHILEHQLGPDHPDVAIALNNLAGLYLTQGKYEEAEPLFLRALRIDEQHLAADHPDMATSFNNLAQLYEKQGKYAEAEPLYRRALDILEQLSPHHRNLVTALNNLAKLYLAQAKYEQAESLLLGALAICEEQLFPDHPDVAQTLINLAELCEDLGKYEQVEPLLRRVLHIREQQFGPEHPNVATALNNLAALYCNQGAYEEAEPLFIRSLAIREEQFSPDHPDVAQSLNNLAQLYRQQGKLAEAESLSLRALSIREQHLAPDHPNLAYPLNNLAGLYLQQGKYSETEPLYRRAVDILERQSGPEHPDVATALNNLAELYRRQGKYSEAEPLYLRALQIDERLFGPTHPDVAVALNNLASLYYYQGKYSEAEPLYLRALQINEQLLVPTHPEIQRVRRNLATLKQAMKKQRRGKPPLFSLFTQNKRNT